MSNEELPYSKGKQLSDSRKKKEPMFGKKPSAWRRDGKIKPKKVKKNDILDNDYLNWQCTQPCVITGETALRGAGAESMHTHHIKGRNRGTNDYETVPLKGYVHSWGVGSYHSTADSDFKKKWIPHWKGNVKSFFLAESERLKNEYMEQGGVILENYS